VFHRYQPTARFLPGGALAIPIGGKSNLDEMSKALVFVAKRPRWVDGGLLSSTDTPAGKCKVGIGSTTATAKFAALERAHFLFLTPEPTSIQASRRSHNEVVSTRTCHLLVHTISHKISKTPVSSRRKFRMVTTKLRGSYDLKFKCLFFKSSPSS